MVKKMYRVYEGVSNQQGDQRLLQVVKSPSNKKLSEVPPSQLKKSQPWRQLSTYLREDVSIADSSFDKSFKRGQLDRKKLSNNSLGTFIRQYEDSYSTTRAAIENVQAEGALRKSLKSDRSQKRVGSETPQGFQGNRSRVESSQVNEEKSQYRKANLNVDLMLDRNSYDLHSQTNIH